MNRFLVAAITLSLFAIPPLGSLAFGADEGRDPNVVVMMVDTLGWGELGVYGGGELRGAPTPRLDRLAREGMRLLNFNVEPQVHANQIRIHDRTPPYPIRHHKGCLGQALRHDRVGSHDG